jgi:hypothetical protein
MPVSPNDLVRPFQTPQVSPGQLYLSQYNLAANTPIFLTPGFGSSGSSQLPPIQTGSTHFDVTVKSYCQAAQSEKKS